jgi:hypothetical protein
LKRPDTLVPQQTLFALNSEFIQDRAKSLVTLMKSSSGSEDSNERITWLYRRLFGRDPLSDEMESMLQFVQKAKTNNVDGATADRWQILAHAMLASNEFSFVD